MADKAHASSFSLFQWFCAVLIFLILSNLVQDRDDILFLDSGEIFYILSLTPLLLYQYYPFGAVLVAGYWINYFSNSNNTITSDLRSPPPPSCQPEKGKNNSAFKLSLFTVRAVTFTNWALVFHAIFALPSTLIYDEISISGFLFAVLISLATVEIFKSSLQVFENVFEIDLRDSRTWLRFTLTYNFLQLLVLHWFAGRVWQTIHGFITAIIVLIDYVRFTTGLITIGILLGWIADLGRHFVLYWCSKVYVYKLFCLTDIDFPSQ